MPTSGSLLQLAAADARKYGLPVDIFLNQIRQESGFDPNARSSAGAEGIAQFMPGTARGVGLTNPWDPVASLDAAARFDSQLLHRYGSIERALSAYNSGRPDAYRDPNFAGGQTFNYVRKIVGGAGGGTIGGGAPAALSAGAPAAAAPDTRRQFVAQLLAAISPTGQLNDQGALVKALQLRQSGDAGSSSGRTAGSGPAGGGSTPSPAASPGGVAELLREGTGGPTHSTGPHIHAAFNNPQLELAAIQWAEQHGLHVGENPYVGDAVDPVHAPHSYHYQRFQGLYNGRPLGRAIDVSGPQSDAFYSWLAGRR